ncbi:hypothetical protein NZA98_01265, partial [Escherichia coli]|nr:hypothetical protein [Escherichia coli]
GTDRVDVATKDGWYDVSFVDAVNTDSKYLRRYAGHIETGKMSRTDPAIGMIYDEVARVYIPAVVYRAGALAMAGATRPAVPMLVSPGKYG